MGDRWLGQAGISFSLFSDRDIHGRRDPTHATGDSAHFLMMVSQSFLSNSHSLCEGCTRGFSWVATKCTFSPLVPDGTATEVGSKLTWRMTKESLHTSLCKASRELCPPKQLQKDQLVWPPPHLILPTATVPRDAAPLRNGPCTRPSAYRLAEFSGLQDFLHQSICLRP